MKSTFAGTIIFIGLLGVFAFLSLGTPSLAAGIPGATTTACVPSAYPFVATGATWGTAAEPVSAGPGDSNVPLTVSLLYNGGCALTAASFEATLAHPFEAANGANQSVTYEVNVASDSVLTETFYVNIASGAPLEAYTFPLYIGYNTSDFAGIFSQSINFTITLRGSPKLDLTDNTATFTPGEVNNLTLSISNVGTGPASSISTTVAGPSSVGILNQLPTIKELSTGSTVNETLEVFVPQTLSGSAVTLSVSSTYYDPYSFEDTASQALGFNVLEIQPSYFSVALTQLNNTSTVGTQSTLTFILTNSGGNAIYSPDLAISASSPVVVTGSVPLNFQTALQPGQSIDYDVTIGSSPSSTPGIYGGSVTVGYSDADGVQHSQTFTVGFVLKGSIQFLVQDVTISQTATDVTVSGSLLNEGNANAYYTQVTGQIGDSQNSSTYVGEVDTNTPTPFTVTVAFPAPSRAEASVPIDLTIGYQDTFGAVLSTTSIVKTSLESAEEIALSNSTTTSSTGSTGGDLVTIVSYSIIIIIVVVVIAAAVFVRRSRSAGKPSSGDKVI